jgi:hypothetical protein
MGCAWRTENGLRYLYADYRGASTTGEMLAVLEEQIALIEADEAAVRLLIHVDSNHKPPSEFLDAVKHAIRERMASSGVRVAILGVDGIGRLVLRGLQLVRGGMGPIGFADKERALAFLSRP